MTEMTSVAYLVAEFHAAFDLPRADAPALLPDDQAAFRQRLLDEETAEVAKAVANGDVVNLAQELADVVYVAYGTALAYGVDLDAVLAEVHRANMAKLGPDGLPVVVNGKVVKPAGWQKPNIARALGVGSGNG